MVRRRIQLSAVMVIPLIAVLFGSAGAAQPVLPAFVLTGPTRGSVGNELAVGVTATAPEVSTRATTLTFVLSRDRTSDAKDLKLAGKAVIPALQAKARQSVVAMLAIPLSTRPGAVFVIGCTTDGSDCSASGTKVQLTQNAVTTDDLVQTAVEQGTLDASTGLVYRVYGAFGDPRLPRKFAGEPTDGTAAMEDAIADWSTLPKPAQEAIRPYLLPPAAQGSWVDQSRPSGALIEGETTARSCEGTRAAPDWENIPAASGKVRLWWSSSDSELGKKVKSYVDEVSRFYADFKALLGREPLSDATVDKQCFHGVDGALDVYFVPPGEQQHGNDAQLPPEPEAPRRGTVFGSINSTQTRSRIAEPALIAPFSRSRRCAARRHPRLTAVSTPAADCCRTGPAAPRNRCRHRTGPTCAARLAAPHPTPASSHPGGSPSAARTASTACRVACPCSRR